jgi:hypothetical protein
VGELHDLVGFLRARVFDETQAAPARALARALLRTHTAKVDTGAAGAVLRRVAFDLWSRHPEFREEWAPTEDDPKAVADGPLLRVDYVSASREDDAGIIA